MNNTKLLILDRASFFGFLALAFFLADTIKENNYFLIIGAVFTLIGIFFGFKRKKEEQKQLMVYLLLITLFSIGLLLYFFWRFDLV
ncbi:MAG: LPXTG cell wall anchor domain-containing protein [Lewinellaceae bacterium]|nr:LPXTG cell wall anchor domain-containing protein [Lewinellaceae bacterium]